MSSVPKNADASSTNGKPDDVAIDNKLRDLFTDGSGIVRGVCSTRNIPGRDTHCQLADGTVHTFHVYADENASTRTNLYVPKSFSKIERVGKSTVVATNPTTREAINFYHVRKTEGPQPPPNDLGSRCIGQIGGAGAERPGDMHTHATLFKSRASRDHVEAWRMEPTKIVVANVPGFPRDINSAVSEHVRDIRSLV